MKQTYIFSINNNHVVCNYKVNGKDTFYDGFKAITKFEKIDKFDFTKIIANKTSIKLSDDTTNIIIKNIALFDELNLTNKYLTNTIPKIKKAIKEYQIKRVKKHIKKNIKLNTKKVATGALTCSLLLSAYNLNDHIKNNEYENNESTTNNELIVNDINDITTSPKIEETQTDNTTITQTETTVSNVNMSNTISLDIECKYNGEEYKNVVDNYGELIDKYATKWGISPSIITAIIAQESGARHTNLMNILYESWEDHVITVYNHEDNCYTKLVLTNNKEKYDSNVVCINQAELMNKNTNISYGSAILAYTLKQLNYNIPLSITAYNCGIGGVNNILTTTSYATGINIDSLINDQENTEFLNYTYVINQKYGGAGGDEEYLKHVLRYVEEKENGLYVIDEFNTTYSLTVDFQNINTKTY